jgi:hypothetical protein
MFVRQSDQLKGLNIWTSNNDCIFTLFCTSCFLSNSLQQTIHRELTEPCRPKLTDRIQRRVTETRASERLVKEIPSTRDQPATAAAERRLEVNEIPYKSLLE